MAFEQNKEFLNTYFSGLLEELAALPSPFYFKDIQTVTGKRGKPTIQVSASGETHFLHSQYNPIQEAERWAAANPMPQQGIACIVGWGLGYHVIEWIKQHGTSADAVIIIEAEPQFLTESLSVTDFKPLMNASNVDFILGINPAKLQSTLMKYADLLLNRDIEVILTPFAPLYPQDLFRMLSAEIRTFYETKSRMLRHMSEMGELCQTHSFQNIPNISQSIMLSDIQNAFPGEPAIIVGAGPSLDNNISQLSALQEKAWVFAVDTSARVLLQNDVQPHFVVTKDPTSLNASHFKNLQLTPDTVLAFDPQIDPEIVQNHPGKLLYMPNRNHLWHQHIKGCELQDADILPLSNNVALAACNAAAALGCSPIIFVGLDFCFSQDTSHAAGSALRSNIKIDQDQNTMTYSRGDASETVAVQYIEGIDGNVHPTTPAFSEALHLLEQLIKKSRVPCIDASEGGAKIGGTQIMSLQEAASSHCTKPVSLQKWLQMQPKENHSPAYRDGLTLFMSILKKCRDTAAQSLKQNDKPFDLRYAQSQRESIEERFFIYHILQSALERLIVEINQPGYWNESIHSEDMLKQRYENYFSVNYNTTSHFLPVVEKAVDTITDEDSFSQS